MLRPPKHPRIRGQMQHGCATAGRIMTASRAQTFALNRVIHSCCAEGNLKISNCNISCRVFSHLHSSIHKAVGKLLVRLPPDWVVQYIITLSANDCTWTTPSILMTEQYLCYVSIVPCRITKYVTHLQ